MDLALRVDEETSLHGQALYGRVLVDVAIIGVGNVGTALGGATLRAGHDVVFAAKDAEHARDVAAELGGRAAATSREAAEAADVIVLAVWYTVVDDVLAEIGDALAGKVVVDVTNPVTADYSALAVEVTSAAEEIQRKAPAAHVVKAFNTVFASLQADPVIDGKPVDGLVAGDDEEAKGTVIELVRSLGMRPLDAGGLRMARALEQLAFLNISMQLRHGWSWQTAWKLAGPAG
jgi:NADPH-dependent F420 reductase